MCVCVRVSFTGEILSVMLSASLNKTFPSFLPCFCMRMGFFGCVFWGGVVFLVWGLGGRSCLLFCFGLICFCFVCFLMGLRKRFFVSVYII